MAEAAYEQAEVPDWQEGSTPATYKLSKYFPPIVERLLITTDRQDAATANLRSAAYEALMEMIKNSPKDCYEIVKTTIRIVLDRLQQVGVQIADRVMSTNTWVEILLHSKLCEMISASNSKKNNFMYLHKMKYFQVLQMESRIQSQAERSQYNDLQSLLCSTLQRVLRKVEPADAPMISDSIMRALLQMFQSSVNNKTGGVQEDALMCVSTLVEVLGKWSISILIKKNLISEWKL